MESRHSATPSFAREAALVSGGRFLAHLAHLADGVVLTVQFLVSAALAGLVSNLRLIAVLIFWATVGHIGYHADSFPVRLEHSCQPPVWRDRRSLR